ncbi:hypothetical protein ACQZ5G_10940 [Agrobacterium sp. 22-214-1]
MGVDTISLDRLVSVRDCEGFVKTNRYYPELDPNLKRRFLAACKSEAINYGALWSENRANLLRGKIGPCREDIVGKASAHLFILDFCIIWFSSYTEALAVAFLVRRQNSERDNQHNVANLISWRICTELVAIRKLVLEGLDVPAKQILRSMSENLDALGLATISAEFCADFIEDQDVGHSNKTWHKYISKGKARKLIKNNLPVYLTDKLNDHDIYREEEEKVLSAAAHPSFISSFVSLFPEYDDVLDSDNIGISNVFSPFSLRTLRYCSYRLLMHSVYDLALFGIYEKYIELADYDKFDDLRHTVKSGRKICLLSFYLLSELDELRKISDSEVRGVL